MGKNDKMIIIVLIASFFIAYTAGKILGVGIGIVTFFIIAVIGVWITINELYSEKGRYEWRIERRKKTACRRKISDKVETILSSFGKPYGFKNDKIEISRINSEECKIKAYEEGIWKTVFIGDSRRYGGGSSRYEEKYYEPTSGGEYVERTRWAGGGRNDGEIKSYIPGKWEDWLDSLFIQAKHEEYKKENLRKKLQQEELIKKFKL